MRMKSAGTSAPASIVARTSAGEACELLSSVDMYKSIGDISSGHCGPDGPRARGPAGAGYVGGGATTISGSACCTPSHRPGSQSGSSAHRHWHTSSASQIASSRHSDSAPSLPW